MKIAYIVTKGMPLGGGIEKFTEEVGSRLASRGHEVIVYSMRHYGAKDGIYKGMKIRTVPTIRTRSLEKLSTTFFASVSQCFEKGLDIAHYHALGPSIFSAIPRMMGRKVVVQAHGIEWQRSKWGTGAKLFFKLTEPPCIRLANMVTAASLAQQDYIHETYGRDIALIPSGVNPPEKEAPDLIRQFGLKGGDYILFASRLVREKGAHYLIDAYKRIKTDKKLVIAGDAQHEEAYKAELYRLAKGDANIIFPGFASGKLLRELFTNSYLYVHPSEIEGQSMALLEALSYGNCVLVSDIPENLEPCNDLAYSFRNKDMDDLAEKLSYLVNDKKAATAYGHLASRHVAENYSWDGIADRFEKMYSNLLEKAAPATVNFGGQETNLAVRR